MIESDTASYKSRQEFMVVFFALGGFLAFWLSGNSPDFSPIENVWGWMKMQLKESHPINLDQLREEIKRLWVLRMEDSQILRTRWRACLRGFWRSLRGMRTLPTTENMYIM
jgi:transposase